MPRSDSPEHKLEAAGYALSKVPKPAAAYRPLVVHDRTVYVSGAVPFDGPGNLAYPGKVPSQVSLADAQRAAALCAANCLRVVHAELGTLEKVERVLRVAGYVNSEPDFTDQHLVINGASELLVAILGEAGWHARSAIGVAQLPLGASVELDMMLRLIP